MRFVSIGALLVVSLVSLVSGSMRTPDVVVTLRKLEAATGTEKWSHEFPRNQRPYQCEFYEGGMVVFLRFVDEVKRKPDTEAVFLDVATGKPVPAFDTRHFVLPEFDLRRAASHPNSGSVTDNRAEIVLPNKWTSFGIARLAWGPNNIYFFERTHWKLAWVLKLPQVVHAVSNWQDVLIYRQGINIKGKPHLNRLYGHFAGNTSPAWTFELPVDVPDEEGQVTDVPGKFLGRGFSHTVGSKDIFAFGNGHVFALDPRTGAVRWRLNILNHPAIAGATISFPNPGVREADNPRGLLLFSNDYSKGSTLVYLDQASRSKIFVLRTDLYGDTAPVAIGADVFCFTQKK